MTQSEAILEQGLINTLKEMSYEYVSIKEEENLYANFKEQLEKHNHKELELHGREHFTDKEFEKICIYLEGGTRFEKAKKLRDLKDFQLENGERVWIEFINKQQWCQNEFQVSNQITVEGRKNCRYDVTILINGLPLVQIELKRRGVELKEAYNQVQRYHKTSYHGLFDYIQLFVISNGVNTRYFANNPNCGYKFTFNWTDAENVPFNNLSKFACFFFDKCNLGKMISKYVVLHEGDKCLMVLRPYQFYAVERILDRVQNSNKNGYIWHTTGAGKTLTSFKAAQLVAEIDGVDKVMFVVDRHDLDTQTQSEYEAFEPGAVDNTDNTRQLIKRLKGDSKIIITTIQKLNCAVTRDYYNKHLQDVRNQKVVMIFDECHRSHFGECHKNIVKFFNNLQIFGFTGTPIFADNANQEHTTAEVFGECLHRYLIKDAIADENVLGFLVEYYKSQSPTAVDDDKRMTEIAQFILNNFNKSTYDGEFNALFAIQSVPMLLKYYKIFKSLNPKIKIGAIFTYAANDSQDDELTGTNQGFANEKVTKILTIETSGIPIAFAAGAAMHIPVVFAKKHKTSNVSGDVYKTVVHSYTHGTDYTVVVESDYLSDKDNVLIVDDFLANGKALKGLLDIVAQAGASSAGAVCAIEKGFQHGGDELRADGIRVESLAIIDSMEDGKIVFRKQ